MISSQALATLSSSYATSIIPSSRRCRISSTIRPFAHIKKPVIVVTRLPNLDMSKTVVMNDSNRVITIPMKDSAVKNVSTGQNDEIIAKLNVIVEAISERVELHQDIREQCQKWRSLWLNYVNMITLTATTMAGVCCVREDVLALKVSSVVLFAGAAGILTIMNKVQPSQLVEEQRDAVRLYKQLKYKIERAISLRNSTMEDLEEAIERVLALDREYPLGSGARKIFGVISQ